jgi:putative peptidoglycan lipid II flippase
MTALSVAAYAGGLLGLMGVRVLAPAYYARQEMRAPVRVALLSVAVNGLLSLVLVGPLGHVGLAVATSLAAFANGALLLSGLLRDGIYRPGPGWGRLWGQIIASGSTMAFALLIASPGLPAWTVMGQGERAGWLSLCVLCGAVVYGTSLLATGLRPRQLGEQAS